MYGKLAMTYFITINVPLFKKLRDIIFFLTPKLSLAALGTI